MRINRHRNGAAYQRARAQVIARARAEAIPCGVCLGPLGTGPLEADHIVRVRDGGTDDPANLRAVHAACNLERELVRPLPRARPMIRRMR